MEVITTWLFLSFTVERLVELVLQIFPILHKKKVMAVDIGLLLGLMFSLILSYGARLNFFEVFDIRFVWPELGPFFTALFMAGGSNFVHDITEWVKASKENAKPLK